MFASTSVYCNAGLPSQQQHIPTGMGMGISAWGQWLRHHRQGPQTDFDETLNHRLQVLCRCATSNS